jgi:hypothetical protein
LAKRDDGGVDEFRVEASFRFEAESIEAAGASVRRVMEAAEVVGFEIETATVNPSEPKEPGRGTGYGPRATPPPE